ncbi:MAG: thiol peroxidase [Phocaeicola sp.]
MKTITFKGTAVTLAGNFIEAGSKAPDFSLIKGDLTPFQLANRGEDFLVLNIFPSLDTGVCAASVRKFNKMATQMANTKIVAVSKDLPFAQNRFCGAEGIENVITTSDYHFASTFGKEYGVLMTDGPLSGLLARAVVIINPAGEVIYSELVPEITQEPNYDAALAALKENFRLFI